MTAVDCDGRPAPGIHLDGAQRAEGATALYFDSGVLSNTADETDASGIGGFIRLPPGFAVITGQSRDGLPVGEVGVLATPPFVTYTVLAPGPVP